MSCPGCDICVFDGKDIPSDMHEIHVTVRTDDIPTFVDACEIIGVKPIVVGYNAAATGKKMYDPMTSHKFQGTERKALEEAERIARELRHLCQNVVRIKIETTPTNPVWKEGTGYFESHIGIKVRNETTDRLRRYIAGMEMYLSRNAFKEQGEYAIFMATRRMDAKYTDPDVFTRHMHHMKRTVEMGGFETDRLIIEYCWYDSNEAHDNAWMG